MIDVTRYTTCTLESVLLRVLSLPQIEDTRDSVHNKISTREHDRYTRLGTQHIPVSTFRYNIISIKVYPSPPGHWLMLASSRGIFFFRYNIISIKVYPSPPGLAHSKNGLATYGENLFSHTLFPEIAKATCLHSHLRGMSESPVCCVILRTT